MSATSGACTGHLPPLAGYPEAEERHAHLARVGHGVDARSVLVDPDRRNLGDGLPDLARGKQELDVEEKVPRLDARQDPLRGVAAQHLRAALRVAVRKSE